LVLGWVIVC